MGVVDPKTLRYKLLLFALLTILFAKENTFVREYAYQVSDNDTKITSRENAFENVKSLLKEDISSFYINEINWEDGETILDGKYIKKNDYEKNIQSMLVNIDQIKITYEMWNGKIYLLKGKIDIDLDDIREKIKKNVYTKLTSGELGEIRNIDSTIIPLFPNNSVSDSVIEGSVVPNENEVKFVAYDNPPQAIIPINPIYPEKDRQAGIEGIIYVQYFINRKGKVTDATVLKGIPDSESMDEAALEAVKKSKWVPAKQGDKEVGVWQTIPIKFEL